MKHHHELGIKLHIWDHIYMAIHKNNLPVVPHKAVAEVSKIGNL